MTDPRETLPTLVDSDVFDGSPGTTGPSELVLLQTAGFETGRVLSSSLGRITLGRSAEAVWAFEDAGISPIHGVLHREGDVLTFDDASGGRSFVDDAPVSRTVLAVGQRLRMASVTLRVGRMRADERLALERLWASSERDGLTGLLAVRHLDALLGEDCAYARRHGEPYTLVGLDVEGFRTIVERHGYAATDALLQALAAAVVGAAPPDAKVFRTGGDELAVAVRDRPGALPAKLVEAAEGARHGDLAATVRVAAASLDECEDPTPRGLLALVRARLDPRLPG